MLLLKDAMFCYIIYKNQCSIFDHFYQGWIRNGSPVKNIIFQPIKIFEKKRSDLPLQLLRPEIADPFWTRLTLFELKWKHLLPLTWLGSVQLQKRHPTFSSQWRWQSIWLEQFPISVLLLLSYSLGSLSFLFLRK